jgi:hypothetical protein
VADGQILALTNVSEGAVVELESVLEAAHARHIEASWVEALKSVVRRYRVGND